SARATGSSAPSAPGVSLANRGGAEGGRPLDRLSEVNRRAGSAKLGMVERPGPSLRDGPRGEAAREPAGLLRKKRARDVAAPGSSREGSRGFAQLSSGRSWKSDPSSGGAVSRRRSSSLARRSWIRRSSFEAARAGEVAGP